MRKARRPAATALALALALQLGAAVPAAAADITATAGYENGNSPLNLTQIARYASGQFNVDGGVMEIVAYNKATLCLRHQRPERPAGGHFSEKSRRRELRRPAQRHGH